MGEHNPEEIWETTKSVLKDLYHSDIAKKHKIRGIGITNQRETTILWDKNLESQFTMQLFGKTEELQIFVSLSKTGIRRNCHEQVRLSN